MEKKIENQNTNQAGTQPSATRKLLIIFIILVILGLVTLTSTGLLPPLDLRLGWMFFGITIGAVGATFILCL